MFLLTVPRRCFFLDHFVSFVSYLSLLYCLVCSLQPCGHLLRKSCPQCSVVYCILSLSHPICGLVYISTKGEIGTIKHFKVLQYFTDRSKKVRLLWIIFVINLSCLSLLCYLVCSLQPCDYMLGNG